MDRRRSFTLRNLGASDVRRIGGIIGRALFPGTTVALYGRLGVGKTFLIRAICAGLGVKDAVTSPTFALVNQYRGRCVVFHIDLYRVREPEELVDLGLDEMIGGEGVCLMEWSEKASGYLGIPRIEIEMEWVEEGRRDLRFRFLGGEAWQEVFQAVEDAAGA